MVLTLNIYNPLMPEDDAESGSIMFAVRVLTRRGEVVIDFGEFLYLETYRDNLSVEGASGSFTLTMRGDPRNEELLRRLHAGMVVEVYCARNANPLEGVIPDPSQIRRVDTTPDLSFLPTQPVPVSSAAVNTAGDGVQSSTQAGELSPNRRAFLDVIAYAEGTSGPDGYRTMFTGRTFDNGFTQHPNISNRGGGLVSTAAGRYQFLTSTWNEVAAQEGLTDFSPASQDRAAIALIRRRGALEAVDRGDFESAVRQVNREWASMPGSPYGQPVKTVSELRQVYDQSLQRYQLGVQEAAPNAVPVSPVIETQQNQQYRTTLAAQRYGAPRSGGRRKHAGVDLDISGDATAIAFLGGVCTRVDRDPGGYWDYVDLYNSALNVVERIAEYRTPLGIKEGDVVRPGQAVGRGEIVCGTVSGSCGVIHYELQEPDANNRGKFGYATTKDPIAFLRQQGIDPYATPDKVFQNARVVTSGVIPSGGAAGGSAQVAIPPVEVEGAIVEPVEDYYLDKCPYLLMHGIIKDYGQTDGVGSGTSLTISGEGYGKVYKDANILLDSNAPSTVGHAFEIRNRALVPTAVSFIYYQILRNWVEVFWGHGMGWEARTRVIPIPPNYMTRINEGSAWSALQFLAIPGFFHLFCDHTGALVWEKLPWSSNDQSLIDGRNWEDLPVKDIPAWKIINWDERLSESGITNFLRVVPTFQHVSGGQPGAVPAMCYNVGSMRQYGGTQKKELQVPMGTHPDQWYTSGDRRRNESVTNSFQDLCVLEAIRWEDRPIQLCNASVRGEAGWRIHTRVRVTETWRGGDIDPGEYYVTSRGHNINPVQGTWTTSLSLVRDRRTRYLGIGNGSARVIEEFPEEPGNYPSTQLAPDEYWFFDRTAAKVIPIGNDAVAYAGASIVPRMGEPGTVESIIPPETEVNQTDPLADGEVEESAEVQISTFETDSPPGAYTFTLERGGDRLTVVPSPINGRVVASRRQDDYGHYVEVKGSDGLIWRIAHLDSRGVSVGRRVRRGQSIGNQGRTGFAENPHVLLEFRRTRKGVSNAIDDRTVTRPLVEQYLEFIQH